MVKFYFRSLGRGKFKLMDDDEPLSILEEALDTGHSRRLDLIEYEQPDWAAGYNRKPGTVIVDNRPFQGRDYVINAFE